MSPENEPDEADGPTGPEEADQREVRRLLADAAEPLTMPAEVSTRLDDARAGLVAERRADRLAARPVGGESDAPAPSGDPTTHASHLVAESKDAEVVALSTRRRRWPRALLAAASVLVVGYGASVGLDLGGGASELSGAGDASDGARESSGDSAQRLTDSAPGDSGDSGDSAFSVTPGGPVSDRLDWGALAVDAGYADLRSDTLAEDVRPLGEAVLAPRAAALAPRDLAAPPPAERGARAGIETRPRCERPTVEEDDRARSAGATAWLLVRYDGRRATLVLAPLSTEEYLATVYSCAGANRLASTRVTYR